MKKKFWILYGLMLAGVIFLVLQKPEAESPSSIKITLFKTELLADKNAEALLVFESTEGSEADLVNSPNSLFGEGEVAAGEYKRLKLTLKNSILYSGPNPCVGNPIQDEMIKIDSSKGENESVELYFATAEDGGSTGWAANGSSQTPFLLQNPIVVKDGKSTVLKLIFNTVNTLQCIGGSPTLIPPTITVVNYVEEPSLSTCSFPAEYWFTHFNTHVSLYKDGNLLEPTLASIFDRTEIVSGWGMVRFGQPDSSGMGTFSISVSKKAEEGGMAEHRHELSELQCLPSSPEDVTCETGYHNPLSPDVQQPFSGRYTIAGGKMIMEVGEDSVIGALSKDCSFFIGVNISKQGENDIVVAVKKTGGFTGFPKKKFIIVEPSFEIKYGNNNRTENIWSSSGFIILDFQGDRFFRWATMHHIYPVYDDKGSLIRWQINSPGEQVEGQSGILSQLTITQDGIVVVPDSGIFVVMGANNNGIMAGDSREIDPQWNNHRLQNGIILNLHDSPSISNLDGRWMIVARESEIGKGEDGSWNTGNEWISYGITYGEVVISGGKITYRSFIHKDILTGDMESDVGSGETFELRTDCYEMGKPLNTSPCNGLTIPAFYIKGETIQGGPRIAIDSTANVMVLWEQLDENGIPEDQPEHKGGSTRGMIGFGVKLPE